MLPRPRPSRRHGVAVRPDDNPVGIGVDHGLIRLGARMMRLVDDQDIGRRHLHRRAADRPRVQRLDRGDLHSLPRPRRKSGLDDPRIDAGRVELRDRLLDDLATVRDDQDALAVLDSLGNDGSDDDGLAGPGRRNQ